MSLIEPTMSRLETLFTGLVNLCDFREGMFTFKASTRAHAPCGQGIRSRSNALSAITNTLPITACARNVGKHFQACKTEVGQIATWTVDRRRNGHSKSLLDGPIKHGDATCDNRRLYTRLLRPFRKTLSLVSVGNQKIAPRVARLVFLSCPSQIARFVMTLDINAVQRVFCCGAATDLAEKLIKRLKAEFNTTTSIQWITGIFNVAAAAFRFMICAIFGRSVIAASFAMLQIALAAASTRFRFALEQIRGGDRFYLTATAFAQPKYVTILRSEQGKDCPITEMLSRQILNLTLWGYQHVFGEKFIQHTAVFYHSGRPNTNAA